MKKSDILLVIIVLSIAICILFFLHCFYYKEGTEVLVTVDGVKYGSYSLQKDETIQINDCNVLKIDNGKADMISADCPDNLCVKQKPISRVGESIICLPNKVVVSILGDSKGEVHSNIDVIVN